MNRESGIACLLSLQCFNHFTIMKFSTISANPISILLVSIASMATASGQAPTWNPRASRPLENTTIRPDISRLETSPRMISPYGVFVSYQANVDANGNNIVGDAANECSISVNPTNTKEWRSDGGNLTA